MAGTELATFSSESVKTASSENATPMPIARWIPRIEEHPAWETLAQLQITMRAAVPLNRFRVQDLLSMKVGQVFESLSPDTEDVPLMVGQVQLGWSEFEILEQKMSLRLTRLG